MELGDNGLGIGGDGAVEMNGARGGQALTVARTLSRTSNNINLILLYLTSY